MMIDLLLQLQRNVDTGEWDSCRWVPDTPLGAGAGKLTASGAADCPFHRLEGLTPPYSHFQRILWLTCMLLHAPFCHACPCMPLPRLGSDVRCVPH
jgi:hypothetical protein